MKKFIKPTHHSSLDFGYYCVAEYIDEANAKNVSNKNNKFERNICHRVHREKEKQKEKSYN